MRVVVMLPVVGAGRRRDREPALMAAIDGVPSAGRAGLGAGCPVLLKDVPAKKAGGGNCGDSRKLESGDSGSRIPVRLRFLPCVKQWGNEMRHSTIAYMPNGLPVQCCSERDFLFPDADEKYVPDVLAYIQSYDFKTFDALLRTKTPEEVVATFPYLSDREKSFCLRALFEQWTKVLAEGW